MAFPDVDPTVSEVWARLSTPLDSQPTGTTLTPFVTTGSNVLVGVHSVTGSGTLQETMFVTFDGNAGQVPFQLLGPGILNWLTQGSHFGLTRNYLSVHVDDIFHGDSRWSMADNCTPGEDCVGTSTPPEIRTATGDINALLAWQDSNGVKLDMAYNAAASVLRDGTSISGSVARPAAGSVTEALLSAKDRLRWINHTYDHVYYGCNEVQNALGQWVCSTPLTYVSQSTITSDISQNLTWASRYGLSINSKELISGEHSGLKEKPGGRITVDNPNFVAALNQLGIQVTASDNSVESTQRTVGTATKTLPRYPNSLYYNVASKVESTDEYNWIYGPKGVDPTVPGTEGNCTAQAGVTTCLPKLLSLSDGFDTYIAPFAARETLGRLLGNDPRPHFVHQSNIAETVGGDSLVYTWLNLVLNGGGATVGYKQMLNEQAAVVNPTMSQASLVLTQQADWAAKKANVTGYILNGQVVVTNGGSSSVWVPLSANQSQINGTWGEAYQGTRSDWTQLSPGQTLKVDVGANAAPVASFTKSCVQGTCTFTSTTTDADSEVSTFAYLWEFGDGSTSTKGPATDPHSYADGTYQVKLTVTDARGAVGTATDTLIITDSPNKEAPVAVAEIVGCTGLTCTFDGSKSTDPDGIASYAWNFGDGSTGTGAKANHTFPSGGDFTVKLTVTDRKAGSGSTTVVARVTAPRVNKAPIASFEVTCIDLTCGANASGSSDPDGSIVSYQWAFGDGTGASGVNPLGHVFPGAGSYEVTLVVYDNDGAAGSATRTVAVSTPAAAKPPAATTPSATVKAKAVSKNGKIKVDVDPNQKGKRYWKVQVQKRNSNGSWSTLKKAYKTQGKKETRTINLNKGVYRVLSQPKYGYGTGISAEVTLKK